MEIFINEIIKLIGLFACCPIILVFFFGGTILGVFFYYWSGEAERQSNMKKAGFNRWWRGE